MANYCNYEIHVKGSKKAALMLYSMIPCASDKQITHEEGTDDEYIVWLEGDCKWSLDSYCEEKPDIRINLDDFTESDIRNENIGLDYWYITMRQKSEILGVEILAHSWSEESDFESYEVYKDGKLIKEKFADCCRRGKKKGLKVDFSFGVMPEKREIKDGLEIVDGEIVKYTGNEKIVAISDDITSIGERAFCGCKSIESFTVPCGVTSIGDYAFENCENLTTFVFNKSLKKIGVRPFKGADMLESFILPADVEGFEGTALEVIWNYFFKIDRAFTMMLFIRQCPELVKNNDFIIKKIKANKKAIFTKAAENDNVECVQHLFQILDKITLDEISNYILQSANAQKVTYFLLDYKNKKFPPEVQKKYETDKIEKVLGIKQRTVTEWKKIFKFEKNNGGITITGYKGKESIVEIPSEIGKEKVVAVADCAFAGNEIIEHVVIPDSVTDIGSWVFGHSSKLKSVLIPDSVEKIGDYIFANCPAFTIECSAGSYAEQYAKENNIKYITN